jgi:hypothetical protein
MEKIVGRYKIFIKFKQEYGYVGRPARVEPIIEFVKTLKEAKTYKSLIDSTVKEAHIIDMVTNKIVENWVN